MKVVVGILGTLYWISVTLSCSYTTLKSFLKVQNPPFKGSSLHTSTYFPISRAQFCVGIIFEQSKEVCLSVSALSSYVPRTVNG